MLVALVFSCVMFVFVLTFSIPSVILGYIVGICSTSYKFGKCIALTTAAQSLLKGVTKCQK